MMLTPPSIVPYCKQWQTADVDKVQQRRAELATTQLATLQLAADALARKARAEERALRQLQSESTVRRQRERSRLDGDREQLQRKRRHLQLDEEHVQQRQQNYDARIRRDGQPLFERKDQLQAEHAAKAVCSAPPVLGSRSAYEDSPEPGLADTVACYEVGRDYDPAGAASALAGRAGCAGGRAGWRGRADRGA